MNDHWSYDKNKYHDSSGMRWHFVRRTFLDDAVAYEERPVEVYFRNDDRSFYGLVHFERSKDIPYKHEKLVEKVVNDSEFRKKHEKPDTAQMWIKSWK